MTGKEYFIDYCVRKAVRQESDIDLRRSNKADMRQGFDLSMLVYIVAIRCADSALR